MQIFELSGHIFSPHGQVAHDEAELLCADHALVLRVEPEEEEEKRHLIRILSGWARALSFIFAISVAWAMQISNRRPRPLINRHNIC